MEEEKSIEKLFWKILKFQGMRTHKILHSIDDIHPGQQHLLSSLLKKNGQSQRELASNTYVKPSTINVSIQRLEKNGLVEKKVDENDNRFSRVYITEKGINICNKISKEIKEVERLAFTGINDDEKEVLRGILLKIYHNLYDSDYSDLSSCNKELKVKR